MNRRGFITVAGAAAAAFVLDPERLLWRPGARTHILAPSKGWRVVEATLGPARATTMTLPLPLPHGWRFEDVPDPVFEAQRDAIMAQLNQNAQDLMALMVRPAWTYEVNHLLALREQLRGQLLQAYDLRRLTFRVIPPEGAV